MKRRAFLRTGLAVGVVGAGGATSLPAFLTASPRWRRSPDDPVRLSSNENPLGISPAARRAIIDGLDRANRYPGASKEKLLPVLAKHLGEGVEVENLQLGNGSTEVIQMVVQSLGPKVQLVIADPTFEDIPRYAEPFALRLEKVPIRADFSHDIDGMRMAVGRSSGPSLVYVCNPNNPTGTVTSSAEIDAWIEAAPENVHFLVDEAYFEYAAAAPMYWSALKWIHTRKNVVVVRTFSKIYGMAGLRLGYAIAHPEVINRLEPLAGHNNANHVALTAALASLRDPEIVPRSLEVNRTSRGVAHRVLEDLDLAYLPSHTNFLMHRIRGELDVYIDRMKTEGIRVGRPFPPMLSYSRLSFGLPEEMELFAEKLRAFRQKGWV